MVSVDVRFSPAALADARRSHARLRDSTQPRREHYRTYYDIPDFNDVQTRTEHDLSHLVAEVARAIVPDTELISATFARDAEMGAGVRGLYDPNSSTKTHAVIAARASMAYDHVWLAPTRLRGVLWHELLHHEDREFLLYKSNLTALAQPAQAKAKRHPDDILFDYLAKLRTEGYASFNPDAFGIGITNHDASRAAELTPGTIRELEANFFHNRLQWSTEKVAMVCDRLAGAEALDWYELSKLTETDAASATPFCPYLQGSLMFGTIALSDKKRHMNISDFHDLFALGRLCDHAYRDTQASVRRLQTFGDFFQRYFDAAYNLNLPEEHIIVKPAMLQPLLDAERRHGRTAWTMKQVIYDGPVER